MGTQNLLLHAWSAIVVGGPLSISVVARRAHGAENSFPHSLNDNRKEGISIKHARLGSFLISQTPPVGPTLPAMFEPPRSTRLPGKGHRPFKPEAHHPRPLLNKSPLVANYRYSSPLQLLELLVGGQKLSR